MTEFVDPPLPFKVPIQIFQPSIPSKCSALTCSCCAASKISSNLAFSGQLIDTNNHLPKKTHRGILRYFVSLIENGWFRIFLPEATGINRPSDCVGFCWAPERPGKILFNEAWRRRVTQRHQRKQRRQRSQADVLCDTPGRAWQFARPAVEGTATPSTGHRDVIGMSSVGL